MILPFFILYLTFNLFPILFSFAVSFTKWNGVNKISFIGFDNYLRLFTADGNFYKTILNTLIIIAIAIPLQLITGLLMSVILNDFFRGKLKSSLQLLNFLPYITTPVAIGMLFQILFDWKYGTINLLLQNTGLINEGINWLGKVWTARIVVILLLWWKYYGYMMVIFISGLSTMPEELYEAAKIDGAKWKDSFFRITIPLLRPIITFVVVMSIIGGLQLFDEPQLLFTSANIPTGGPERSILTAVWNLYDITFARFDYGYGASMAYGLFVLIFIISTITFKSMKRGEEV